MIIKRIILDVAKRSTTFRMFARGARDKFERNKFFRVRNKATTDKKLVYFQTFSGRSYGDSPKAIYKAMLEDERFSDYCFVWSFLEPEKYAFLEENPNTKVIKSKSEDERKYLARAGYWISNYRILDFYWPKNDQIYVQCWHGTPLKRLGYDLANSDNVMNSIEEIREKYRTDAERFTYFLSPSAYATDKFVSAWNMKAVGKENAIIEEGYPRNDELYTSTEDDVRALKKEMGIDDIGNKKIILYAPTWRDNQHVSGVGYTYQLNVDFDYLREKLSDDYIILFRAHYLVANSFDFEKYKGFVYNVSNHDDVNGAFLVSDMLVTDYSSVFFDYANLKRPEIFYMYDMEEYRDSLRGFYISTDELPGPIVKTEEALVDAIKSANTTPDAKYEAFVEKYDYKDDGHAAERVIDKLFFSNGRE